MNQLELANTQLEFTKYKTKSQLIDNIVYYLQVSEKSHVNSQNIFKPCPIHY